MSRTQVDPRGQKRVEASSREECQREGLLTQHTNVLSSSCLTPEQHTHRGDSKAMAVGLEIMRSLGSWPLEWRSRSEIEAH